MAVLLAGMLAAAMSEALFELTGSGCSRRTVFARATRAEGSLTGSNASLRAFCKRRACPCVSNRCGVR